MKIKRCLVFFWNLLIGALLCHLMPTAILVVGWMSRRMQREIVKCWWKKSPVSKPEGSFEEWVQENPEFHFLKNSPHWFTQQTPADPSSNRFRKVVRALFHSFGQNLKIGIQGILNVWILTLPAIAFWFASWHIGWNTSFNKVYEQAPVGVTLGLLGILFFILSMFYVLPAQSRQSITGNWRSYYDFRILWTLIRQKGMMSFWIASVFSLASVPVVASQMAPTFFTKGFPELDTMSDVQLLEWINRYFFWVCVGSFFLYERVHLALARLYASAFLKLVQQGNLVLEQLTPFEQTVFKKLQLQPVPITRNTPLLIEVLKSNTRRLSWVGTSVLTGFVWLTFVLQLYLFAFINYQPFRSWLNQPLVQIPCFRYVPPALEDAVKMQQEGK